jgi:AAA family ATP:ADP antiporter
VSEAKKYYPLFGMFANVALVFSGQFVRYVSTLHSTLPAGRWHLIAPDCT